MRNQEKAENGKRELTLGSLFDGSGGFCLGGAMAGIRPVWASEVEPYPIRVTTKRFPEVKHYGDVSKIKGGEVEPVDVITFGSPCQDMSVAGRRAGLDGERSGLFHQAIRIIKEMKEATNGEYPKYCVWENVPGAFTSNNGADFEAVLEEVCSIKNVRLDAPRPAKWAGAGEILADGFSCAWRTLDAQFWGVPQRRKRIYLVADFTGERAGEILFESEGLSGYSAPGFGSWKAAARGAAGGAGGAGLAGAGYALMDQGGARMDAIEGATGTLRAQDHGHAPIVAAAGFKYSQGAKARGIGYQAETAPTIDTRASVGALLFDNHGKDGRYTGPHGSSQTLTKYCGTGGNNLPLALETSKTMKIRCGREGGGKGPLVQEDKSATLATNNDQILFAPKAFGICSKKSNSMLSSNPESGFYAADTAKTLDRQCGNPSCNQGGMAIVAFAQNQRDEVRDLGEKSGALAARPGMKQQTFVCEVCPTICASDCKQAKNGIEEKLVVEKGCYAPDKATCLCAADAHLVHSQIDGRLVVDAAPEAEAEKAYCIQGSMIGREDANGPQGSGVNEGVSFTLNTADRHAACFANSSFGGFAESDVAGTKRNRDDPFDGAIALQGYAVRRLTPTECARLQGFPDWWARGLGEEEPSEEEIAFFEDVFRTHQEVITGVKTPKTRSQIVKWLKNPESDSAEYKMWGNGVALPNVWFVMEGIKWMEEKRHGGRQEQ